MEPENALYNYCLAYYYFSVGMQSHTETTRKGDEDVIYDQHAMEEGLAEYRKAIAKPYYRSYHREILQKENAMLPTPRLTEDYLSNLSVGGSHIFPEAVKMRPFARKVAGCARLLVKQGRQAEAEALVESWKPVARHFTNDAYSLMQLLTTIAFTRTIAQEGSDLLVQMGDERDAQQLRMEIAAFEQPQVVNRIRLKESSWEDYMRKDAAHIITTFSYVFGERPSSAELAPLRYHEHILVGETALNLMLILFTLVMLWSFVQSAVWYNYTRLASAAPILLLPSWKGLAGVLGYGLLLPLVFYSLYACIPAISGRMYGVLYLWPRFTAEFAGLLLLLLALLAVLAGRLMRRRCEELGVPVPDRRCDAAQKWGMAGLLIAVIAWVPAAYYMSMWMLGENDLSLIGVYVPLLAILAGLLLLIRRVWIARRAHALYHGTVARSLAPVYALAIILLSVTAQPLLLHAEAYWLRQDTLIFSQPGDGVTFTPIEARTVEELKHRMLKALDTPPSELQPLPSLPQIKTITPLL